MNKKFLKNLVKMLEEVQKAIEPYDDEHYPTIVAATFKLETVLSALRTVLNAN